MRADLTERLGRGVVWNTEGPGVDLDATDELMCKAADELDRLRAALEEANQRADAMANIAAGLANDIGHARQTNEFDVPHRTGALSDAE